MAMVSYCLQKFLHASCLSMDRRISNAVRAELECHHDFGNGCSVDNLESFRRFYRECPNLISDAAPRKSQKLLPSRNHEIHHAVRVKSWQSGRLYSTNHPKTPPLDARLRGHDGDGRVGRHSRESGNSVISGKESFRRKREF